MRLLKYAKKVLLRKRMSTKSVSKYKKLLKTQVENLHAAPHFNTKHLVLCTTPKNFRTTVKESLKRTVRVRSGLHSRKVELSGVSNTFMPLSALSTMSHPSVQTVIKFTNRIPKIMVHFCYLRLYFGVDNVCRRLLQWIARIKNGLKLRPTTRYRTYSNQKYKTDSDQIMKVPKKVTLK